MTMIRPMPSPRGTNNERLFILRGRAPTMAHDSKHGLARDEEYRRADKAIDGGVESLVQWAEENLSRRDVKKLISELEKMLNDRVEEELKKEKDQKRVANDSKRRDGRDADPSIRAITDAVFRAERAKREYYERFPDARRLGYGGGAATAPSAKPIRGNPSALKEYYERFPDARRLV